MLFRLEDLGLSEISACDLDRCDHVHLDLEVQDIEEAVALSTRLGATRHGIVHEEPANFFQVMSDPEGNEFCFILLK